MASSRKQPPEPQRALAGNPDGGAPIPAAARPVNTSHPDQVIGNGTAASCTSAAVVAAVAKGGVITFGNRCDSTGPDLGGAAIRALSQYQNRPVYVSYSTFRGGVCSNGGALSSIGVSWTVLNSLMTGNQAIGDGANPARTGTPGGGSGGAIYNDGDTYHLKVEGTIISGNHAREGGGAIFFVSNDRTGTLLIKKSTLHDNPSDGFSTAGYPGIFFLGQGHPVVISATIN